MHSLGYQVSFICAVADYRFERMGVFTYSHEEGTRAFERSDLVAPELAEERRAELMAIQKRVHVERNRALVGQRLEVLVDGRAVDGEGYVGRTWADAPEVDASVLLPNALPRSDDPRGGVQAGEVVRVEITEAADYDLVGRVDPDGGSGDAERV